MPFNWKKTFFVVCHYDEDYHRVCIIDNTGEEIECYGGSRGSGMGQLNGPVHLAIDRNGSILVADMENDRIVQLDASLKYMNEFANLKDPYRLRLNEARGHLYVTDFNDSSITFLDIVI